MWKNKENRGQTLNNRELMLKLFEEAFDGLDIDWSNIVEGIALVPADEKPVNLTKVRQMMENAVNQQTDKLDAHVLQVTKDFHVAIMQN